MANTKRVYLTRNLKDAKHGARIRTKNLDLSLDDYELNYFICRHNGSSEVGEDFELLSEEGQNMECLAILR